MSSKLTKSPDANLVYLLMRAFRWFDRRAREKLDYGDVPDLTPSQLMLIAHVSEGGLTLSDLARHLGTSRQAVHQTAHELARLGIVELVPDPGDGRARQVRMTEAGKAVDRQAVATIHELERELARRIGKDKVAALRAALEADWD